MNIKKKITGILVFTFLFFTAGIYVIHATSISEVEADKKKLEQKKQETERKVQELKKDKSNLLTYIEKLDQQVAELDIEIEESKDKIEKTNKKLKKTKKELKEAKEEEEKQYASMQKRIKYMYENGEVNYLEMLLEAESISDLLNSAEYIAQITEYDNNLLENHKKLKAEIEVKEKNLETQVQKLALLEEELEYDQSVLSDLIADKNKEVEKFNQRIDTKSDEAKEYAKEIEKQEDLIEDLLEQERKRIEEEERKKEEERKRLEEERRKQEEANKKEEASKNDNESGESGNSGNDSPDYSQQTTDFRWPLNTSGKITSYFGGRDQPTEGASTNHKGIDIGVPTGTAIVAAAKGRVVTATYSSSAGNYIMIYHGNSTYTVYMHCSSLSVSVGDEVEKGQKIAAAGSTGVSTGSHLHFGISVNGSYVNPLDYVSQ